MKTKSPCPAVAGQGVFVGSAIADDESRRCGETHRPNLLDIQAEHGVQCVRVALGAASMNIGLNDEPDGIRRAPFVPQERSIRGVLQDAFPPCRGAVPAPENTGFPPAGMLKKPCRTDCRG